MPPSPACCLICPVPRTKGWRTEPLAKGLWDGFPIRPARTDGLEIRPTTTAPLLRARSLSAYLPHLSESCHERCQGPARRRPRRPLERLREVLGVSSGRCPGDGRRPRPYWLQRGERHL